ncbi:hypothetical protein BDF14DRAFT_1875630 [Spinellus fusiger]|nr:hypothetical protein BDF14DRAFT_1875630 [Spinellus fusiger]
MTFSTHLQNHTPVILDYVGDGIQSLQQFRSFVKDKSHLDRDYGQKLESLTKKYRTFKPRTDTASDGYHGNDASNTCQIAWNAILGQTEHIAKNRFQLVEDMSNSILESTKAIMARKEEARKKKLKAEREKIFTEKDKAKQAYDEACLELENIRAKMDKGNGDQEKYQKQLDITTLECGNRKNLYILSVNVSNAAKVKYYEQDIPALADKIDPEIDANGFVQSAVGVIDANEAALRTSFSFLPWNGGANAAETIIDRDTGLVTNGPGIIFLNNRLIKDKKQLTALEEELSKHTSEMNRLHNTIESLFMDAARNNVILSTQKVQLESEVNTIVQTIGDAGLQSASHDFKSCSFTIPTTCDLCSNTIWGLSKQGLSCRACGFNCHAKCEMKTAPNCSRIKGKLDRQQYFAGLQTSSATKSSLGGRSRSASFNSTTESIPTTIAPSIVSSIAPSIVDKKTTVKSEFIARVLYSYDAQSPDELSIVEGDVLEISGAKDDSGWIMVAKGAHKGLVPANYIEMEKQIALYDFDAANSDELSIRQGDVIQVTSKEDNNWWQGILNHRTGIFPSNYVEPNA